MSGHVLPHEASPRSRKLGALANQLASACPRELAGEIALTGSVSRGLADRHSDIEMVGWQERIASPESRDAWLESAGAQYVSSYPHHELGMWWSTFRYHEVWIELGWMEVAGTNRIVDDLASGRNVGSELQQFASALCHALPLRPGPHLGRWQKRLADYPRPALFAVIEANTSAWRWPHTPMVRWAMVERGEMLALAFRLVNDMRNVWALIHAVNRRWAPDFKWTSPEAIDLPLLPRDFSARLNRVFDLSDPRRAVRTDFQLILDVLELVPREHDVSRARESISHALANKS